MGTLWGGGGHRGDTGGQETPPSSLTPPCPPPQLTPAPTALPEAKKLLVAALMVTETLGTTLHPMGPPGAT